MNMLYQLSAAYISAVLLVASIAGVIVACMVIDLIFNMIKAFWNDKMRG